MHNRIKLTGIAIVVIAMIVLYKNFRDNEEIDESEEDKKKKRRRARYLNDQKLWR
jgi:low affinity Fe/Cu permease